jgi:transcriptional regulator with XRE-family HTH domain
MTLLPPHPAPDELLAISELVAEGLKQGREQAGLTVRALARLVDVSPSFISQIENGKANPSVGTLLTIVSALDISLDELFADAEPTPGAPALRLAPEVVSPAVKPERAPAADVSVVRGSERPQIDLEGGVRWERLTAGADPDVSFLWVTYRPGATSSLTNAPMQHTGREYGLVIEGRLGACVGDETVELACGDSIAFDCQTPHRFWTVGDEPAVAVWTIVHAPSF